MVIRRLTLSALFKSNSCFRFSVVVADDIGQGKAKTVFFVSEGEGEFVADKYDENKTRLFRWIHGRSLSSSLQLLAGQA